MSRMHVAILCCALLLIIPARAGMQQTITANDEARLVSLYRTLLRNPEDASLQKRIAEERARIRALLDAENQLTLQMEDTPAPEGTELPKAIDQQRTIVTALEERLKSRKADLDLLKAEEGVYLHPETGTGETQPLRLTETYEQLLAKKAITEERIASLESVLELQRQRLRRLTRNQWMNQFADVIRIATYAGILLLFILLERLIRGILANRITQPQKRYLVTKIFTSAVYLTLTVWVMTTLFAEHPGILTSLAIVGAGLAVALQDIVKDAVGWLVIIQKRLFTLGDRIAVGAYAGDVMDISVLRTTLLEANASPGAGVQERTGRTIFLPNSLILTHHLVNFHKTSDFAKAEMHLTVTFESDIRRAEEILRAILDAVTMEYTHRARSQYSLRTKMYFVLQEPTGPQVYMDLADDGVRFTLRFTVPIGMRRDVVSRITAQILEQFGKESSISLAYRTSMVYNPEHPPPPLFVPPPER